MGFSLWGIPNCDQVRKARKFLEAHNIDYSFEDIRKNPRQDAQWQQLIDQDQENTLINTRSPSFRKTGIAAKELTAASKLEVLRSQPTAMKRPVLCHDQTLLACGFNADTYQTLVEQYR